MNEKGLVYPLVVTLSFIILVFFSFVTEKVFSERQFVYLQEENLRQVRLLQQGVDRATLLTDHVTGYPSLHMINLNEGNVNIAIYQTTDDERMFIIEAVTARKHTKRVKVYYNVSQKSVTKWVEG